MTKSELLDIIKLLSALESWSFAEKHRLPDYLQEETARLSELLSNEVLK